MSLKVAFITFGCRSNYADSVELQAALLEHGISLCSQAESPDVFVVNTCTVTESADRDGYRAIRRVKHINPSAAIIVTGCMAEVSRVKLEAMSEVDAVVGIGKSSDLINVILRVAKCNEGDFNSIGETSSALSNEKLKQPLSFLIGAPNSKLGATTLRARYHLRVQEGCENSCSYCIVPRTRGKIISRPLDLVLDDILYLASIGYEEIVLSGTHLGAYGKDLGLSFKNLLESIISLSLNIRIRLSSLDPNELTSELIDLLVHNSVFCEHFHLSVQSFSDAVLSRMKRKYSLLDLKNVLEYIIALNPSWCIGADVIVGFPGESRQEAEQGLNEFFALPISYLHVFPYSKRDGTEAALYADQVSLEEKRDRSKLFRLSASEKKQNYYSQFINRNIEVVIESFDSSYFYGTSREYISAKISTNEIDIERVKLNVGRRVWVVGNCLDCSDSKLICSFI